MAHTKFKSLTNSSLRRAAINIPRILLSNFPELSRPAKPLLLQSQYHQFTFHSWCKIVLLEVSHGLGKKLNSFSWLNYILDNLEDDATNVKFQKGYEEWKQLAKWLPFLCSSSLAIHYTKLEPFARARARSLSNLAPPPAWRRGAAARRGKLLLSDEEKKNFPGACQNPLAAMLLLGKVRWLERIVGDWREDRRPSTSEPGFVPNDCKWILRLTGEA